MKKKTFLRCLMTILTVCMVACASVPAFASEDRWKNTTSRNEDNDIRIDFQDLWLLLPDSWSGKCQMGVGTDGVSFYQTKSRQLWTKELGSPNGGWLFSISYTLDDDYLDNPNYQTIGQGPDGGTYYATFPTDLQAYTEDAEAYGEYMQMTNDMPWVKEHIVLSNESPIVIEGDYIFPQSSTSYLSESDLVLLDADRIQMAINEIYARHHRKFVLKEVQDYFNTKSWYSGTIEAADFDTNVMNDYEAANINLMVKVMNDKKAPK